jgi:hypothetical protein
MTGRETPTAFSSTVRGASLTASQPGTRGPFLAWPVTRHAFYRNIGIALLPALAWGIIIFGSRPLAMVLLALAGGSVSYSVIKRVLKWKRAQPLLYMHCLVSVLVLVALAHPTWPLWIILAIALLMPVLLALLGGPGKERVHVAVVAALAVQFLLLPQIAPYTYTSKPDAILARDRLVMGDIRDQGAPRLTAYRWPYSWQISGDDAAVFPLPAQVAADALDDVSSTLPPASQGREVTPSEVQRIRRLLEKAFVRDLPDMGLFMLGMAPNRVGAASLIAVTLAGLYLSYRYILRPRSVLFFLIGFILATACFTFTPTTVHRVGLPVLGQVVAQFPGEMLTLFEYLLLNSDAGLAAVFILALPGTEPLTNRGRRIYLACAAIAAAGLHRLEPAVPAATLVLCILMPLAPLFDRVFTQRSWLHGWRERPAG